MSNTDKYVNEAFVDELLKSGVWDIARVDRGTRDEEELNEALVAERGGKKGDEGAGKDKGDKGKGEDEDDKPDFTTDARKGDKSKTKKGKKDYEDDDNGNGKNESVSAKELAEELMNNLSEDVILEFIDLLYQSVLNEEAESEEEEDDKEDSE